MSEPVANPNECTTPEAWAELVRTERKSSLQLMQENALARQAIIHLSAEVERLSVLAGRKPESEA